ncbi:MAG: hypothetical protein BWY76_02847 [bacterium ADurb.Bin429]|nr:MAG: hypothetical protein BWY76_02847 [bacterium ADurb.Bin429]
MFGESAAQRELLRASAADHQTSTAVFHVLAITQHVGVHHAGPWFGERRFGVGGIVGDGNEITAIVAIQNLLVDHLILGKGTGIGVSVGTGDAVDVDICLHHEALADFKLPFQLLAHLHHGDDGLVAHNNRVYSDVALDAHMIAALQDDLDIAEAQSVGITAHQQLIRAGRGHVMLHRPSVLPKVLEADAVKEPGAFTRRYRIIHSLVAL